MAGCRVVQNGACIALVATAAALAVVIGMAPVAAQEPVAEASAAPETSTEPVRRPNAPEILRGSVAPPERAIEPAAGGGEPLVAAGDRVWFIDQDTGRLTGCRLIGTSRVGEQAIRCTERRLPRAAVERD